MKPAHPSSASPETPPSSLQPSDVPLQHVTCVLLGWTLASGNGEVSQRVSGLFFKILTPVHLLCHLLVQGTVISHGNHCSGLLPEPPLSILSPSHWSSTETPDWSFKRLNSILFLPCSKPLSLFSFPFCFFFWNEIQSPQQRFQKLWILFPFYLFPPRSPYCRPSGPFSVPWNQRGMWWLGHILLASGGMASSTPGPNSSPTSHFI